MIWVISCWSRRRLSIFLISVCLKSNEPAFTVFQSDPLRVCVLTETHLYGFPASPFVIAWLRSCCFQVLQYCHRVVKGSVSSAPSCLLLLTQGDSPGNECCNKLLRHLIFARLVNGWLSGDLIDPDLAARRALAVLSTIMSGECFSPAVCAFIHKIMIFAHEREGYKYIFWSKQINYKDINAFLALFFMIFHYSPLATEMGVLFDFN